MTDDKVNFFFSPFGSGATKAASGVSEQYGTPTVAATASSEEVYNQGNKYLFGIYTPNITITDPMASIIKGKLLDRVSSQNNLGSTGKTDYRRLVDKDDSDRSEIIPVASLEQHLVTKFEITRSVANRTRVDLRKYSRRGPRR